MAKTTTPPVDDEPIGRQRELLPAIDCSGWDETAVDGALVERGLSTDGSLPAKKDRLSGDVKRVWDEAGEQARAEAAAEKEQAEADQARAAELEAERQAVEDAAEAAALALQKQIEAQPPVEDQTPA